LLILVSRHKGNAHPTKKGNSEGHSEFAMMRPRLCQRSSIDFFTILLKKSKKQRGSYSKCYKYTETARDINNALAVVRSYG
jgi:hypothetical protein